MSSAEWTSDDTGVIVLIWLAWVLISTVILPAITGWSVGKLIVGIRIVKADTFEKAGFGANIVRALVWMLDAFPYFLPGLGGVLMLATDKNQRLGDLAASTLVVRAASVGRPPVAVPSPSAPPPVGAFTPPSPGTPPSPSAQPTPGTPPPPTGFGAPPATSPPPPAGPPAGTPAPPATPPASAPPVFTSPAAGAPPMPSGL